MERVITFRAWDKSIKAMTKDYAHICSYGGLSTAQFVPEHSPDLILMQFTGLLDRNGKEIFENDLIKTPAGIGEVKWIDGCYRIYWNHRDNTTLHDTKIEHLEVIGNAFETSLG